MKTFVKLQGRIFNPKKNETRDGASLYNFSMSVSKKDKTGNFINQYIPVTIYTKDDFDYLLDAGKSDVTVVGQLSIKEKFVTQAGKEYPQELSVFGFEAYIGEKPASNAQQEPIQEQKAPEPAPNNTQSNYSDPVATTNPSDSDYLPF